MEKLAAKPVQEAVEFLKKLSPEVPSAAIILGSGVKVLEDLDDSKSVSYDEVFGISPGVVGHSGSLSLGRVNNKLVAILRGRFHCYEGHPWDVVTLPAQVMVDWGVANLYVTNAAGGINQSFSVGDLMILTGYRDHLNTTHKETGLLTQMTKDIVHCNNALTAKLADVSAKLHKQDPKFKPLQTGTYVGLLGPNYETLAEIDMLKYLKCDAVGMSTVPELLTCNGTKTMAAGISVITNVWKPEEAVGGHEEVLTAAKQASEQLDQLFRYIVCN